MIKKLTESMNQKGIKAMGLIITKEGENITVVISPVKINGEPLPNLKATNTAEALEKELPDLLDRHAAVIGSNLEDLEKDSVKKKEQKTATPKKPAANKPKAEKPKPEEDNQPSLFGDE